MGYLGQKLDYLAATKAAIGAEITARGGNITGATFREYAAKIGALEEALTPLLLDLEAALAAQNALLATNPGPRGMPPPAPEVRCGSKIPEDRGGTP